MTIITPTVGRIVWVYETEEPIHERAAIVTGVTDDRTITVTIFGPRGFADISHGRDILLWQEGDPEPIGRHARWMPYQIGQAKKHAPGGGDMKV